MRSGLGCIFFWNFLGTGLKYNNSPLVFGRPWQGPSVDFFFFAKYIANQSKYSEM